MIRRTITLLAAAAASLGLAAAAAGAGTMHSQLAARLAGMGDHGIVNLTVRASSGKLCWSFDVPSSVGTITRASLRTGASGPQLLELGMHYTRSGCAHESAMTLEHLESHPGSYWVWVDTKAHPGDLRGRLFAGMAHM